MSIFSTSFLNCYSVELSIREINIRRLGVHRKPLWCLQLEGDGSIRPDQLINVTLRGRSVVVGMEVVCFADSSPSLHFFFLPSFQPPPSLLPSILSLSLQSHNWQHPPGVSLTFYLSNGGLRRWSGDGFDIFLEWSMWNTVVDSTNIFNYFFV